MANLMSTGTGSSGGSGQPATSPFSAQAGGAPPGADRNLLAVQHAAQQVASLHHHAGGSSNAGGSDRSTGSGGGAAAGPSGAAGARGSPGSGGRGSPASRPDDAGRAGSSSLHDSPQEGVPVSKTGSLAGDASMVDASELVAAGPSHSFTGGHKKGKGGWLSGVMGAATKGRQSPPPPPLPTGPGAQVRRTREADARCARPVKRACGCWLVVQVSISVHARRGCLRWRRPRWRRRRPAACPRPTRP